MIEWKCCCTYCGEFWEMKAFMKPSPSCRKCGDKNVKVKKHERSNVYGYEEDGEQKPIDYTD